MDTPVTTRLSGDDKTNCALIQDLLPLYLEGEVTPASREIIESHLNGCEHCAGFLAGARSMQAQLQRDAQARRQVLAAKQDEQQVLSLWMRGLALLANSVLYLGALFGLALLVGGLFLASSERSLAFVFGGGIVVLVCAGWMMSLLLRYGPLPWKHWGLWLGSIATGLAGLIFLLIFNQRVHDPFFFFPPFALGFLGLVGIWVLTWRATAGQPTPPLQAGQAARPAGQV